MSKAKKKSKGKFLGFDKFKKSKKDGEKAKGDGKDKKLPPWLMKGKDDKKDK